jgi:hypothetical protein
MNNANWVQGKVFTIKFDSYIGHADVETDIVIQDVTIGRTFKLTD